MVAPAWLCTVFSGIGNPLEKLRAFVNAILSRETVIEAVECPTGAEPFSVELDGDWLISEELWTAVDIWEVSCTGSVEGLADRGNADADNDDPVEEVRCSGRDTFAKAGRAALRYQRSGGDVR